MTIGEALAVLAAGVGAGTINTVVGSGTLITFPVLLGVGFPPVTANVSNTIGLVPGSLSGAIGYRRELAGQGGRALRLAVASTLGGAVGAVLLLVLPAGAFDAIVPAFIVIALALIVLQPRLQRTLDARRAEIKEHGGLGLRAAIFGTGVYGGYFGAAQGIMLLAILGLSLPDDLQRLNALKNVLAGLVNLVSALIFIAVADVAWEAAGLIAVGATIGGQLGARYGRRLPQEVLRRVVITAGVLVATLLIVT
jgi:uncharacterized membrane protein YfcA